MVSEVKNKKILIDTSFLIALSDGVHPFHNNAKGHLKKLLANKWTLYLSAIVSFEFLINNKDDNWNNYIKDFQKLDFTYLDSQKILLFKHKRDYRKLSRQDKDQAKDDDKIIAQCINNDINCLITRDRKLINFVDQNIQNVSIGSTRYKGDEAYTLKCINFEIEDFKEGRLF